MCVRHDANVKVLIYKFNINVVRFELDKNWFCSTKSGFRAKMNAFGRHYGSASSAYARAQSTLELPRKCFLHLITAVMNDSIFVRHS